MRFLLNSLPFLLLAGLIFCAVGMYSLDWQLTTSLPWLIASLVLFISSLAWRATPKGTAQTINGLLFLIAVGCSALIIADPGMIRSLWFLLTVTVFASIHCYLFEIARISVVFSGARIVLLALPVIINVIVLAGLYLWNGSLALATIGFLVSVIFALLATLFGTKSTAGNS